MCLSKGKLFSVNEERISPIADGSQECEKFTGYSDEYLNLWKTPSGVQIRRL